MCVGGLGSVLGAGAGLAVGAALAWKASYGLLRRTATVAAGLVLLSVAVDVVLRFVAPARLREEAVVTMPLPLPARFRIDSRIAKSDGMRRDSKLTIDGETWTATWIAEATCTAELTRQEASALLRKRAEISNSHNRLATFCSVDETDAAYRYVLEEANPRLSPSWKVFADPQCFGEHRELQELHDVLWRIPAEAMKDGRAKCAG